MITMLRPAACDTGHDVPKGPRRPSTSPICASVMAVLVAPTACTVNSSEPSTATLLTEMGTSPTPNTHSIMNWPGSDTGSAPATGTILKLTTFGPSTTREMTRWG